MQGYGCGEAELSGVGIEITEIDPTDAETLRAYASVPISLTVNSSLEVTDVPGGDGFALNEVQEKSHGPRTTKTQKPKMRLSRCSDSSANTTLHSSLRQKTTCRLQGHRSQVLLRRSVLLHDQWPR
jgi:hypothetical protein